MRFPTGGYREYNFENNEVPWYEAFSKMKDISNNGYDMFKQELIIRGSTLNDYFPVPNVVNQNNTQKTIYGNEFNVEDFNDVVFGDPSLFIETTFINPAITHTMLNLWEYSIRIGLQVKSGNDFINYQDLAFVDRDHFQGTTLKAKLPSLPNGTYRIRVTMTTPPSYVMANWPSQYGHNSIVRLFYRKKNFGNIKVGGLRIKDIIDREGDSEYKTAYDYTSPGNYCSGHIVNLPEYKEYIFTTQQNSTSTPTGPGIPGCPDGTLYSGYRICSDPVIPVTKTQGSNVGYTNVIKRQISNTGEIKEEFSYTFKSSLREEYLKQYYQETEPKPWQSGKLLSNKKYSNNNLVEEEIFDYYGLENETDKGFIEEINTNLVRGGQFAYVFCNDNWDITIDRRHDNPIMSSNVNLRVPLYHVDYYQAALDVNNYSNRLVLPPVKIPYFKAYSGFDKLKSKTVKSYSDSEVVTQTENYYYDGLPASQGLSKIETLGSANEVLVSKLYYPQDLVTEPFMSQMITANRVGAPIKTEKYKGTTKLFEEKFIYAQDASTSNLLLLKAIYSANFPNDFPAINNPPVGQLENQVTYDKFDVKGNLAEFHKKNDVFTCMIWSYNYQYPVIVIKNLDYASILSVLGESALNTFCLSSPDKTSIDNLIGPLKTAYSDAQFTTYTYAPLSGLTSQTDPKGMTTYYEYDTFQRLKQIKDQHGSIVKTYDYHYKP